MKKNTKNAAYILHVLPANTGRTYRFIKFMRESFERDRHKFLIDCSYLSACKNYTRLLEFPDLLFTNNEPNTAEWQMFFSNIFKECEKIIWHSLVFTRAKPEALYLIDPSFTEKSSWIENGHDIYSTSKDAEAKKIEVTLRASMQNIGSICPINAHLITQTYGRWPISVSYPPDPIFQRLPEMGLTSARSSKRCRVIQLGTDARIFSHIDDIFAFVKKQIRKMKKDRTFFIFPQNIRLKHDIVSKKYARPLLNQAVDMHFPMMIHEAVYEDGADYVNYYRNVTSVILAPSTIIYPEYLFAPVFCGCKLYLINAYKLKAFFPEFSYFRDIGKLDINMLKNGGEYKEPTDLFKVFFPQSVKEQWEEFFDSI